jgi:hypothetical protein
LDENVKSGEIGEPSESRTRHEPKYTKKKTNVSLKPQIISTHQIILPIETVRSKTRNAQATVKDGNYMTNTNR